MIFDCLGCIFDVVGDGVFVRLSIHVEAWPRPCEARPQATGHGENFYIQFLEDVHR